MVIVRIHINIYLLMYMDPYEFPPPKLVIYILGCLHSNIKNDQITDEQYQLITGIYVIC